MAYLRSIIDAIQAGRDPSVQVLLAVSLWAADDVKTPFAALCQAALQSEVRPLGSKQQINAWVSGKTKGMIKEILFQDVSVGGRGCCIPTFQHLHTHAHTHS
jgi:serine protease inhibitor